MEEIKNIFLNVVQNNYKNFDGRARRREFWMFQLAVMILFIPLAIVAGILGAVADFLGMIGGLIVMVASLALIIPSIALSIRRLHDTNKSGWFLLISLIPFGGLYLLYLYITEGDKGANQYGEDPKA